MNTIYPAFWAGGIVAGVKRDSKETSRSRAGLREKISFEPMPSRWVYSSAKHPLCIASPGGYKGRRRHDDTQGSDGNVKRSNDDKSKVREEKKCVQKNMRTFFYKIPDSLELF